MLDLKTFLHEGPPSLADLKDCENFPAISIITPSFNQGKFLADNIKSILHQSYPRYEHIIIDGGSTDSSLDILKRHGDALTYWISEPDRGQSHALNKGLSIATGEIIGWQNSDDLYLPSAFYLVGREFRKHPDMDVLYGDFLYIDEENHILHPKKYSPFFSIKEYIYVGANISNQSVFFRKSALLKAGGFNEELHLAMDFDLFLRLASFARFRHIRAYLGGYRIHHLQKGQEKTLENEREYERIRRGLGLKVINDIPWKEQYRLRKFYYRTRRNLLKIFYLTLYFKDPIYRGLR